MSIRIFKTGLLALSLAWGSQAIAQPSDRASLIAQIEAGGANEYGDDRHAVEVKGCHLTTYRWKKWGGDGWVFWTSFKIEMATVDLAKVPKEEPRYYFFLEGDPPLTLVLFKAKPGTKFKKEKPLPCTPKRAYVPSSRGDGESYCIEELERGFYTHKGTDVEAKAKAFTEGYRRYKEEFCTFLG
jgi:hypothetical protein